MTMTIKHLLISLGVMGAFAGAASAADDAAVSVYGQSLRPGLIKFTDSDYTWNDLKGQVLKVLPDAAKVKLSAEKTCDHLVKMNDLYLIEVDEVVNNLAAPFAKTLPDPGPDGYIDGEQELSARLASRSPQVFNELMSKMPDDQSKIVLAKEVMLRSLTVSLLHDAALANCPEHAKARGYMAVTAPDEPAPAVQAPPLPEGE